MNGKSYIINHRTEKYAKRLNIPEANIIDLRNVERQKIRRVAEYQHKRPSAWRDFLTRIRLPRWHSISRASSAPREKIIVSQARAAAPQIASTIAPSPKSVTRKNETPNIISTSSPSRLKRMAAFAAVCLLIVVPLFVVGFYQRASVAKGTVLGISSTALGALQKAGSASGDSQFDLAGQEFSKASEQFNAAREELDRVGGVVLDVAKIIPGKVKSANALLEAGDNFSQAGQQLTELVAELENTTFNPLAADQSSLTDLLSQMRDKLIPVTELMNNAATNLEKVRVKDLPDEYQEKFATVQQSLPAIRSGINDFYSLSDVLLTVLGQQTPKRYLFIFQNNRELRPTGGFIGSIALVDIYKGKIQNLEVPGGGIYDLAGQLKERLIAPKPLWLVNPNWNIQDSNWFPDFPTSAQKLMWFYERTGGASVDGVISLTPAVIEDLLKIVGPIDMQDNYGVTVDANNFVREAQRWAEITYDKVENKPKKFIGDLLPKLLDSVFQVRTDKLLSVLQVFNDSLADKDFLLCFSDAQIQQTIHDRGWDGSMLSSDKDYLYVVATNIGGGKTDQVVDQLTEHHAAIQSDGSIIDTVTITRTHQGNLLDYWTGKTNVSYLRVYVPIGSTLINVSGYSDIPAFRYQLPEKDAQIDADLQRIEGDFVIDEKTNTRINSEFGKTVFGNWLSIDPGQTGRLVIQYRLPFTLNVGGILSRTDAYSLMIQKQPGLNNNFFIGNVTLPAKYNPIWLSAGVTIDQGGAHYVSDLNTDKYYGILLKK